MITELLLGGGKCGLPRGFLLNIRKLKRDIYEVFSVQLKHTINYHVMSIIRQDDDTNEFRPRHSFSLN